MRVSNSLHYFPKKLKKSSFVVWAVEGEIAILGFVVVFFLFRFLHTTAAHMKEANFREKENTLFHFSKALTKVGVFVVKEKSFVEAVYAEEVASENSNGRTTRPANRLRFFNLSNRIFGAKS